MSRDTSHYPSELQLTVLAHHRLEEQYRDLDQQRQAALLGMWWFLATEVMFFGVLFVAFGVYLYLHQEAFVLASEHLNWKLGAINTVVLLVSSLTMALAVHESQHGTNRRMLIYLGATVGLAMLFLGFKGVEYWLDVQENLIPGRRFVAEEWSIRGLDALQVWQVQMFLVFYWTMTGLHALHVILGILAITVLIVLGMRGTFSHEDATPIEVTGLYWHFVDLVWIFLFPTLYLLGTHGH